MLFSGWQIPFHSIPMRHPMQAIKREELVNQKVDQVVYPQDREKVRKECQSYASRWTDYSLWIQGHNETRANPLDNGNRYTYFLRGKRAILGNSMNITDRKQMEEQILAISMTDQTYRTAQQKRFFDPCRASIWNCQIDEDGNATLFRRPWWDEMD